MNIDQESCQSRFMVIRKYFEISVFEMSRIDCSIKKCIHLEKKPTHLQNLLDPSSWTIFGLAACFRTIAVNIRRYQETGFRLLH